jgi:hypothetical protein
VIRLETIDCRCAKCAGDAAGVSRPSKTRLDGISSVLGLGVGEGRWKVGEMGRNIVTRLDSLDACASVLD